MLVAFWSVLSLLYAIALAEDTSDNLNNDDFPSYVSRPDIQAPQWKIKTVHEDKLAREGYWFVTPYHQLSGRNYYAPWIGPHIYDTSGELVWSGADVAQYSNTFEFSPVDGIPAISFLSKKEHTGYILNQDYTVNTSVPFDNFNLHEFNVISQGKTALSVTNHGKDVHVEKPGYNGTCSIQWQGFQEVDVETGAVLFDWRAEGRISIDESTYSSREPGRSNNTWQERCRHWDLTHFNSVDKLPDGDYLLSARHADRIYKVSHQDGSIVWRLGGVNSDFEFHSEQKGAAWFTRQHHARYLSHNSTHTLVTLMDNAAARGSIEEGHFSSNTSWGMILALQTAERPFTATLVSRYKKPMMDDGAVPVYTSQLGSVSVLKNGNVFIGWGSEGEISEHSFDGTLLMSAYMTINGTNASFDEDGTEVIKSYRAYKMPWVGQPLRRPDVVAKAEADRKNNPTTSMYVSWNGATEVARWEMHSTTSMRGDISTALATSPRTGFETRLEYKGLARYIVAVAFDRYGNELGRSRVVGMRIPLALQDPTLPESGLRVEDTNTETTVSTIPPFLSTPTSELLFCMAFASTIAFVLGLVCARWWKTWRRVLLQREMPYSRIPSEEENGIIFKQPKSEVVEEPRDVAEV